mgnify:CR=1 FL=1
MMTSMRSGLSCTKKLSLSAGLRSLQPQSNCITESESRQVLAIRSMCGGRVMNSSSRVTPVRLLTGVEFESVMLDENSWSTPEPELPHTVFLNDLPTISHRLSVSMEPAPSRPVCNLYSCIWCKTTTQAGPFSPEFLTSCVDTCGYFVCMERSFSTCWPEV